MSAVLLNLNQTEVLVHQMLMFGTDRHYGGGGWIRTNVLRRDQIYSLAPLTTRPPLRSNFMIMVCLAFHNVMARS